MRLNLTAATKMWLLTSLAFIYVIIQYHVSITWSLPTSELGDQENETNPPKTLWLEALFDDSKVARLVQNVIGEKASQDLLERFNRQMMTKLCLLPVARSSLFTLPTIYVVTPTYRRPEQIPELIRLSQTLMHVENVRWLLIEDANRTSDTISNFLKRTGIPHVHLNAVSANIKYKGGKPRGVGSRNRGIHWIRQNAEDGVVYFADDDNTYDIELFKEMRNTKKVSMWPVGLITQTGVSSPIVKNGRFVGFYDGWIGGRKFPVDMAGFAVNVQFLKSRPRATMAYKVGYEEDSFLRSLAPLEPSDIELKADGCTKILVWHTQAKKNPPAQKNNGQKFAGTNIIDLNKILV